MSRKKKGSANRKKAKFKVALIHEKIANIRSDYLQKTANKLLADYSFIAMEKLESQTMAQHNFGKSIYDVSWDKFANILRYKAESAGTKLVFVNPKNTTKECSSCSNLVEKSLWERQHNCPSCGLSIDRDVNAAINILKRATVGQTGSNACGVEPMGSAMKQEVYLTKVR